MWGGFFLLFIEKKANVWKGKRHTLFKRSWNGLMFKGVPWNFSVVLQAGSLFTSARSISKLTTVTVVQISTSHGNPRTYGQCKSELIHDNCTIFFTQNPLNDKNHQTCSLLKRHLAFKAAICDCFVHLGTAEVGNSQPGRSWQLDVAEWQHLRCWICVRTWAQHFFMYTNPEDHGFSVRPEKIFMNISTKIQISPYPQHSVTA